MTPALKLYEPTRSSTEQLVREHMPMVKRVAVHLKVRLPPFMDLAELVQVGMVGLIEAAQAFDPSKGDLEDNTTPPAGSRSVRLAGDLLRLVAPSDLCVYMHVCIFTCV